MILGIGSDLVDMRRIEKVLKRHGKRFARRCFTDTEIKKSESRRNAGMHIAIYAKRFAAKEACAKALGTGFSSGIYMRDISIENEISGQPTLVLTGQAKKRLEQMLPQGHVSQIHVSLTDEPPLAEALVVIEAVKA